MTHNNDHDFQQFRGRFDDAMIPDASFKAKMEKLFQSEKPIEEDRKSTVLASPPRQQSETVVPGRRSHPLMVAVAVLTVFAVAIASVWVLSGDVLEDEYASAPSGIATLPADAEGTPGPDVHLTADLIPGTEEADQLHGIFEGVAVYQSNTAPTVSQGLIREDSSAATPAPFVTDSSLTAVDVTTGDRLWAFENTYPQSVTVRDKILIIDQYQRGRFGSLFDREIVAIDLHSGELLWENAVPDPEHLSMNSIATPAVSVNGLVILPSIDGTLYAWDLQTGEFAWKAPFDPGEAQTTEFQVGQGQETEEVSRYTFAASSWQDQVLILNGDGILQVLDPGTGDTVSSSHLLESQSGTFTVDTLGLYPLPNGVLLMRGGARPDGQRTEIVAFNPNTGELQWAKEFDGHLGLSVSENGSIAMNSVLWQANNWFLQLIGRHGSRTVQFHWLDGETGEEILRTERSKSEMYHFGATDGKYACTPTAPSEIVCFDLAGTRHLIELAPGVFPQIESGMLFIPTQNGLYRVDLP